MEAIYHEADRMDVRARRCADIRQKLKNEAAKISAIQPETKVINCFYTT